MNIIEDIVSLLDCDEKSNCPEVTELSLWDGGTVTPNTGISDLQNIAKGFSSMLDNLSMPNFSAPSLPFGDLFGAGGCNSGPVACGPPTVKFFGGRGSGAAGNLIIGALGEIMGIDMVENGINYDRDANAVIIDTCGKGQGAVIRPVVVEGGITNINVIEPGTGYLSVPDGSTGGDGKVWAKPDDTTITRADGEVEIPYAPRNLVTVLPDDIVLMPPGTEVVTEPLSTSDIQQVIVDRVTPVQVNQVTADQIQALNLGDEVASEIGGEERIQGGKPHIVKRAGKFTTPPLPVVRPQGNYPSSSDGAYPAIMYLCDVVVESPGISYNENDKIIIEPNAGASAVPKYNSNGGVESVKVTAGGEGFTQMPDVYIKSETGFNSELKPVFCPDRIAKDEVKEYDPQGKVQLVTIIDCVGQIDRNKFAGYVNGEPYYGPFHVHPETGVKMVGARHVDEAHDIITSRPNTPTKRSYINQGDIT